MFRKNSKIIIICTILAIIICISGVAFATSSDKPSTSQPVDNYSFNDVEKIPNVKENIYNSMLNSVDFYDAVKGSYTTTFIRAGEEVTVSYQVDIPAQVAYESIKGSMEDITLVCLDETMHTYDANRNSFTQDYYASQFDAESRASGLDSNACLPHGQKAAFFDGEKMIYDRVVDCGNGERGYYYRHDITNTSIAGMSIFPQSLGMALLTDMDNWDIVGVEKYLGRQAVVIKGVVTDDDYAKKISSSSFTLYVDIETGVLLDFKGYSASGELGNSITTQDISFLSSGTDNGVVAFAKDTLSAISRAVK